MSGFNLITGNRLEILAENLANLFKANPLTSPFAQEVIIVQSQGMARWLSLALAERLGISANYRFPFPNSFIQEIFAKLQPESPAKSTYDDEIITLKIIKALPELINQEEFHALKTYLEDDHRGLKLYQLAGIIADTFDQYTVYRPEMILGWESGKENHWQATLWRYLTTGTHEKHDAALAFSFLQSLKLPEHYIPGLPARVTVFGIPSLPPIYLQILFGLANFIDIFYYVMNPCQEFWADIISDRETERLSQKLKGRPFSADDLHLEHGNSLLASMGALGREFFSTLLQADIDDNQHFDDPGAGAMLQAIQSDILNLRERGQKQLEPISINNHDYSIQIHSCHSPMREIEVLHDNLLALFECDKKLTPKDILVMTPDIEKYAPFIQAVFGSPENHSTRIPFSIADRSLDRESSVIDAFMKLLGLADSRFEPSKIAAILEIPVVHERFGLALVDVDMITDWIRDVRIRWGIDGKHRAAFDQPEAYQNTWQFGIDRLLLGYAMPGWDENMFAGILPYDNMEGDQTEILGKFAEFFACLEGLAKLAEKPKALDEWASLMTDICETFIIADDDTQRELQVIRETLNNLIDNQRLAEFNMPVHLDIVKTYLNSSFTNLKQGFGFIAGAVTFCAMLPMRSIPFKVICLVGLNHDSFPRQAKHLTFDLIAKNPRPGDRSIRNTDRYLFLETLLSARQVLYISYVGQSIEDNSPIPPSVVVSELLDYTKQAFLTPEGDITNHVLIKHRLQAFSPEYFKSGSRLFSYSQENHEAAKALLGAKIPPSAYISQNLPQPDTAFTNLTIDQLCRFYKNPTQYLLNSRFDIYLKDTDFSLEDRMPYELTGLDRYDLENRLLDKFLLGADSSHTLKLLKAEGLLPHGTPGEALHHRTLRQIGEFAKTIKPHFDEQSLAPLNIKSDISSFTITGAIDNIKKSGLLQYRPANVKAKDLLGIWIKHLLLNSAPNGCCPRVSFYFGKDYMYKFTAVDNSTDLLARLIHFYSGGLVTPLKLFPESSLAYAESIMRNKSNDQARNAAALKWSGTDKFRGESEDLYYRLCFKQVDPLDNEFREIAIDIFKPLLENCERAEL